MKKLLVLVAMAMSFGFAQSEPHTHDGFFLSIAMGFGYQNIDFVTNDYDDNTTNLSGTATDIDVKIGGRIANNLLLHMTLAGTTPTDSYSDDGDEYKTNMSLLGIGATYYFMYNFLATATLGISQFRFGDDIPTFDATVKINNDRFSQSGFGFQLGLGKEWWVSDNWGIGATAALLYGFAYNLEDARDGSLSISARLTATWN